MRDEGPRRAELRGADMIAVHDIQGFCCSFNRQIEQLSAVPDDRKQIRSGLKEILSVLN